MRKILLSMLSIGLVAVAVVAASNAFFSDTETSTGNTFVAGAIDLMIDNESYAIDWNIPGFENPEGKLVASAQTSWQLKDLTIEKFFNFRDLKPGDYGEDTISVRVESNDAWLCAAAQITGDNDVDYVDPELADDQTVNEADPGSEDGELDQEVYFAFWKDDGDNVLEVEEESSIFLSGPLSAIGAAGQIALADSQGGIFGRNVPATGGETFYIGKYWCFGEMNTSPVTTGNGTPVARGTGFTCDGSGVNNAAQTDMVEGDLQFYAVQSRNNPEFKCSSNYTPAWLGPNRLVLENKNPNNWDEVFTQDGIFGVLTWDGDGVTFDFNTTFEAEGLDATTEYSLIYSPDPWPQGIGANQGDGSENGNTVLGTGISDAGGNLTITGNPNLGYDLPHPNDANFPNGAKIWLVLSADHSGQAMTGWNPTKYLFETEFILYDDTDI